MQAAGVDQAQVILRVAGSAAALGQCREDWESLAVRALEPNVFYEPTPLLAAINELGYLPPPTVLLVYLKPAGRPDAEAILIGLFPFFRARRGPRGILRYYRLFTNMQCGLNTPLIDGQHAELAIDSALTWLDGAPGGARYLGLFGIASDGDFARILRGLLARRRQPWLEERRYERALFRPRASAAEYLEAAISGRHRKGYRRLQNRLAELGELSFRVSQFDQPIEPWTEDFLALEARGWKGVHGNAMLSSAADRAFFRALLTQMHARRQLMMVSLVLNQKPIAMKCNLLPAQPGAGAFAYKIAYDEDYARYSPGVLLEIENIRLLHELQPGVAWMDSSAFPDHPMINRLWLDRREIVDLLCGSAGAIGRLGVAALALKQRHQLPAEPAYTSPGAMKQKFEPYLEFDPQTFVSLFPDRPFPIRHRLVDHPLLQLERLAQLASELPPDLVECNMGSLPFSLGFDSTPVNGMTIEETVRQIEECESWMGLKQIQLDPEYRTLLWDCVRQIYPFSEIKRPGTQQLEAYIFISSPGSVTPFHFDDEHNFLLQVRGSKTMHMWDARDPNVVTYQALERAYNGSPRNIPYKEELAAQGQTFELRPGDGLHVPVHNPHWVQNGPEVSISLSITFRSAALVKESTVHWFNAKLRERGWSPRPFQDAPVRDTAKYFAARAVRRSMRYLGR